MKHLKKIISFLISLVLMFLLIASVFFIFFNTTLTNADYYNKRYEENNIIDKVYESLSSNIEYIFVKNNISKEYAKDCIKKSEVKKELEESYSNLFDYFLGRSKEIKAINTEKYMQRVDEALDKYVNDNGLIKNEVSDKIFLDIKDEINNNIKSEISIINMEGIDKIGAVNKIRTVGILLNSNFCIAIMLCLDVAFIVSLLIIWKKKISKGISWIGNSFVSSGIIMVAVFFSGYLSRFYNHLAINPEYIRLAFAKVVEGYFVRMTLMGSLLLCIGIILLVIYLFTIIKNNTKNIVSHNE